MDFDGLNIVVCGASPAACAAAGMLAHQGHRIWLYISPTQLHRCEAAAEVVVNGGITISRSSRSANPATSGATVYHELRLRGEMCCVTSRAAEVVPTADVVIITGTDDLQVLSHELSPFLHRRQMLLALQAPIAELQRHIRGAITTAAVTGSRVHSSSSASPVIVATESLPWSFTLLDAATVRVTAVQPLVLFSPAVEAGGLRAAQLPQFLGQLFNTEFRLKTSSSSVQLSMIDAMIAAAKKEAAVPPALASGIKPRGNSSSSTSSHATPSSESSSSSSSSSCTTSYTRPVVTSPFLTCQQQQIAARRSALKGAHRCASGQQQQQQQQLLVQKLSAGLASSEVRTASGRSTVAKQVHFLTFAITC